MNESMVAQSPAQTHDQYVQEVTAGRLLRDARVAAGVHIAALAVTMKIPVSKLEALESDDFSVLPDIVFVRALASSVCRTLKMDPEPVLALLPQGESPRLSVNGAGLNAPVKGFRGKSSSAPFAVPRSRPLFWAVGLLLIGAALMIFLPRGLEADLLALFKQRAPNAAISTPVVDVPQNPAAAETSAPASPASSSDMNVAVSAGDLTESVATATPAAAAPSVAASEAMLPASGAPAGVLAFKARSQSWIQVRDATGTVVLQRNLAPGEFVSVSGALPLAVVIGRADATEVFVRGKPYELGPVSRENVARFEVK
ncbi:hypothetical protein CBP36_13305 [Acidovorax carolinensis]|uniref:Cytoskeleton protein RodZ-like C-terminal domain-containing protein n=1 Tax=Acidovorax carolinensis TaxID=553814 RepID=A0A240UF27_9BURK|nr:helix-turn-helix domain-containing protein [Acidovorax carolinensis]ART54644.1 hypothetical protein CBP35_05620 [Acidovorax carolinensis]ART59673.1 hypothetical protein CBP36_13305 [Acidovorax carolinensis]